MPLVSVSTTVSLLSRALSSVIATGMFAVVAPGDTETVPELAMEKSLPAVAVPPTVYFSAMADDGAGDRLTDTLRVPASSAAVPADEANEATGSVTGVWLVKVSRAMRTLENLPVPPMLVITPWGTVAGLESENSVPSSVPAS